MEKGHHNKHPSELPNFCHLGVNLRIVLTVELALIASVIARVPDAARFREEFIALSALAQPALLVNLLVLCALSRWLRKQTYPIGVMMTLGITLAASLAVTHWMDTLLPDLTWLRSGGVAGFTLALGAGLLGYFNLRGRALSPAISEARLQALQARIRPHFLFNSLNAVLSLVRSDPRHAERALEDLAELFRALMSEARQLVALSDEIRMTRAYLELEQLRLGDRLRVVWHIEKMPADALIPPLLIQPLAENAVYYGIEPEREPGEISINIYRSQDQVHVVIRNPLSPDPVHRKGNGIALDNIRERLLLHFDLDATLKAEPMGAVYQVHIHFPYTRDPAVAPARTHR
ncbi:MAG: sensor histidine kinase [Thiobacillus sp.]